MKAFQIVPRWFSFGRVCFQWNVGLLECWRTWGWRCGCLKHSTLKLVIIWWWWMWWWWFLNYWNTLKLIIRCLNSDTFNFEFDHFMMMMIIWWLRPRWTRLVFLSAIFPRLERVFPSSFSWLPCKFKHYRGTWKRPLLLNRCFTQYSNRLYLWHDNVYDNKAVVLFTFALHVMSKPPKWGNHMSNSHTIYILTLSFPVWI